MYAEINQLLENYRHYITNYFSRGWLTLMAMLNDFAPTEEDRLDYERLALALVAQYYRLVSETELQRQWNKYLVGAYLAAWGPKQQHYPTMYEINQLGVLFQQAPYFSRSLVTYGGDKLRVVRPAEGLAAYKEHLQLLLGLLITKAMLIAETEFQRSAIMGQIVKFTLGDIRKVRWITMGDDRVCSICSPQNGKVYQLAEIRGRIPAHPRCRCQWEELPHG